MTRIAPTRAKTVLHANSGIVLCALISLTCGCSVFQSAVNHASHWQENRADCPPFPNDSLGNNDCVKPCVALEPTEGYLQQGPTFGGEQIIGNPSVSAIDRMLELTREVESLRAEKADLQQQLELAEETIHQQDLSIDAASQELQRALADFNRLRDHLAKWEDDARQLQERLRDREGDREQLLSQFEADLQDILSHCEMQSASVSLPASDESLAPPLKDPAALTRPDNVGPDDADESTDADKSNDSDESASPAHDQEASSDSITEEAKIEGAGDEELPLPLLEERPILQSPVFSDLEQMPGIRTREKSGRGGTLLWVSDRDAKNNPTEALAPIVKHMEEHSVSLVAPRNQEAKHDPADKR